MLCSASLSSIRVVDTLRVVKSHKVANRCFRAGALRKRFVHAVCASFVHCTSFCMLVTRYDPYSKLRNLLPAIFLGVGHACQHSHNSAAGSARLPSFAIRATMSPNKGITLYTAGTPNGWKASIICEELGIDYKVHPITLSKNEQKEDWFLKINPNGRIPAIVDHDEGDLPVFESGAVLLYLAEKHGKFLPTNTREKAEVISWLMWQMGGLGPMQGQANHFFRYAPEKIEYGIKRYQNETKRLYEVMEKHLSDGREWLAAGQYTIADMAAFGWVYGHDWAGVSIDDLPNLKAWHKRIEERPAVDKALDIPEESFVKAQKRDPKKKDELIEQSSKFVTTDK